MTEEERREMTRSNYAAQMEMLGYDNSGNPLEMVRVTHGRWLGWRHHWAWLVCDQCEEKMLVRKSNHGYIQQFPHNYCPNCGAKMDGGPDV